MTTHIIIGKGHKAQLNGDLLTGDTFASKDYIKKTLDGKWIADKKAWRVDVSKVNRWLSVIGSGIRVDDAPVAIENRDGFKIRNGADGWCDKCKSYCYGDCDS